MLNQKVIIITGASSGIGKEIASQAAQNGARLVLVARRQELLESLKQTLIDQFQAEVRIEVADMSNRIDIERVVAQTKQHFGRIDVLINGAGYGTFKRATEFSYSEMQDMFAVNTFGMMYLSQLVAAEMIQQGSGHLFFIASIAGKLATPSTSVYSASKFAVIGYANALRLELKDAGIHVTTVNPGPVNTPFFSRDAQSERYFERVKRYSLRPEMLAKQMIQAITRPKRELNLPITLHIASKLAVLFPKIADYLIVKHFNFKEDSL
ncbi:MAG: SDR family oxidoreductase [Aerococcaceae bacterium]|nr:SDR family oxidoreductase [Aerococcaceae bacterium]